MYITICERLTITLVYDDFNYLPIIDFVGDLRTDNRPVAHTLYCANVQVKVSTIS